MNNQSDLRGLRKRLAEAEKELADQKWVFEQFLKSPTWRWTAPARWIVNRLRSLWTGEANATLSSVPSRQQTTDDLELLESETTNVAKASFTVFCRVALESFLASGATLDLPHSANPSISIVVVLFNRAELTLACLRSIAENHSEEVEVIVVDNASTDETARLLERLRGARVLRNTENRRFLMAANQAARECKGEHILFLNNDAQLLPGALSTALKTIRMSPDIGAVGGKLIRLDGSLQEAGSIVWQDGSCAGYGRGDDPLAPPYNFRRDVDYCSGAFLLTPRKVWDELGGFDPIFEAGYYEETDYCMRLWKHGLRVVYEPSAAVVHYEFGSGSIADAVGLQARHQKVFAERHRDALIRQDPPGPESQLRARSRHAGRRIVVFDDRVPHLWLGSGFPRANALLQALCRQGYLVTLYLLDVINEPWDLAYTDIPREVEIITGMGRMMIESFLESRRDYYSAIIISRPHNMGFVAPVLKGHPKWFRNVNVIYDAEALFASREVGLRNLAGTPMSRREIRAVLRSEIGLTALADRVISVSEAEVKAFRDHGIERVDILGHSIEPDPGGVPFESRQGFLFVGAVYEEVSPNADSLIWLLTEIFPRIRERLGDVPLTIAGVNRSERIRELAGPGVRLVGQLPTLKDLYAQSKVFVAPTRYGAGIPHKVHEAAAHGLPVVATPLLADQLGWTCRELAVAEDAGTFAQRCIETYTDREKWAMLREAALDRVRTECSPKAFEETILRIVEDWKFNADASEARLAFRSSERTAPLFSPPQPVVRVPDQKIGQDA